MMDNTFFHAFIVSGAVFYLVGLVLFLFPPKKINRLYGYRTSSSMANKKRWDFAQVYAAKEMMKLGVAYALISLIGFVFKLEGTVATYVGMAVILAMLFWFVVRVERAIKQKFGNPASGV